MTNIVYLRDRYFRLDGRLRIERLIELITIVVLACLLLQLLFSGVHLIMLSKPDAIQPSLEGIADTRLLSAEVVDADLSNEIRTRPLFWSSRRPVQPVAVSAEVVDKPESQGGLDKMKLVGLFGSGEKVGIIALVKGKKRRILLKEDVEGWTLDSVERNEAIFTNGPRREKLILLQQKYVASPVAAAADVQGRDRAVVPSGTAKKSIKQPNGLGFGRTE